MGWQVVNGNVALTLGVGVEAKAGGGGDGGPVEQKKVWVALSVWTPLSLRWPPWESMTMAMFDQ